MRKPAKGTKKGKDFESSCNEMESECPIDSFKLIAKQEHCYIEKEFKGNVWMVQ